MLLRQQPGAVTMAQTATGQGYVHDAVWNVEPAEVQGRHSGQRPADARGGIDSDGDDDGRRDGASYSAHHSHRRARQP